MKDFPTTDRTQAQTGPEVVPTEAFLNDSERRAFIHRWIARNRRRLGAGLGMVTLALPLLATAQQDPFVDVSGLDGVTNIVLGPNGTATITLANGQSIVIPASQVQVVDGTILISASAAEFVAEAALAAIGAPAAVPGGVAIAGGVAAAAAVAAASDGGGGGGSAVFIEPLTFGDVLGIGGAASDLQLSGTVRRADDDAEVRVIIRDAAGNDVFTSTTPVVDNAWNATVDSAILEGLPDGAYTLVVELLDEDGEVDATRETQFTVDFTPPVIAINAISGDDVLNLAERGEPLTISGTTDAENGQQVTVTLNGVEYTGTVQGGAWSVTVPAAALAALPDGAALDVEADVQDIAGNDAVTAVRVLNTDFAPPAIAIDPVAGDDTITLINRGSDLEVTGTTDAEDGQIVTVTFAGVDYASAPVAGGTWSATIPQAVIDALEDEASVAISARVTDAAGNPAATPARTLSTDFSQPALTIDPIAGDDIINAQERSEPLEITGGSTNLEAGRPVTVTISGPGIDDQELTGNTGADGSWSATLANPGILSDGAFTVTVTATNLEGVAAVPAERAFTVDTVPPQIGIATPVVAGGVLNAAERDAGITVQGTTDIEDGQPVAISISSAGVDFGAGAGEAFEIGVAFADGGSWDFLVPPAILQQLPDDGSFVILPVATNLAGNTFGTAAGAATDFTPPVIAIDDVAGNNVITLINQGSDLEITGTTDAEDGQIVTVTFDGVDYDSAPVAGGTWSATIPQAVIDALADEASIDISARVADAAGNPAATPVRTISTDFSQPTLTINPIAGNDFINLDEASGPLEISGGSTNLEPGTEVTVTVTRLGSDVETVTGDVGAGGVWTATLPSPGFSVDGAYTLTATASTAEGLAAIPASRDFIVDTIPPVIAIDTPLAGDGVLNAAERDAGITISGTSDAEDGQFVTLGIAALTLGFGPVEGGVWSIDVPGEVLEQLSALGSFTVSARVFDRAGNPSEVATAPLDTDFIPPELTINALPWGDFLSAPEAAAGQAISGHISGEGAQDVIVEIGGVDLTAVKDGIGNWNLDLSPAQLEGLAEGPVQITVRSQDDALNPAMVQSPVFTVDFTPPGIGDIAILVGGEPIGAFLNKEQGADEVVTVTGTVTGNDGQPVTVAINGIERTATPDGDSFSVEFEAGALSGLADGDTSFAVSTTDAAGNPATATSGSFTVDYTPPDLVIGAIGDDGVVDQSEPLTVTGTALGAEGQEVTVTFAGTDYTGTVGGDGSWSVEIPASAFASLAPGETLTFTANVSDAAGNPADEQTDDGAALYLASDTFLAEVNRVGNEIRIGVFIDPMREFDQEFFALDETVTWDTSVVFFPRAGAPATAQITPQPAYQPEQLVFQSPTSPLSLTNTGEARFTAIWVAELDENDQPLLGPDDELLVPAVPFPLDPMVSFSLTSVVAGQPEVVVVNSQGEVGGPKALFIGTAGDDSITADNVDTVIRGRGGDDSIDVSAGGVNTIFFETTAADNGTDLVTGFSLAANTALPDRIGFAGLDASELRGTGEFFEFVAAGDAIGVNTGFVVFTTALTSDAEGMQALADLGLAANDIVYVLAGDGTNAELLRIVVDGDGALPAVDDLEVLAEFQGIGDLAGFSEDNILGFSSLPT